MEGFLNWGIQSAVMLGIGAIGYFLKENSKKIDERIDQNELKIEKMDEKIDGKVNALEEKLSSLKEELPEKYVLRDDFIRATSNIDQKLDKIYDMISIKKGGE